MRKRIVLSAVAAALAALLTPALASAYGAAHVGYTYAGPNGVYHEGATVAGGYGAGYHTAAVGGSGYYARGDYHPAPIAGVPVGGAAAYNSYHYASGYAGGAGYNYNYIR